MGKVMNISGRLLSMNLTGGKALHLAPKETSRDLTQAEMESPSIQKHLTRNRLKVVETKKAAVPKPAPEPVLETETPPKESKKTDSKKSKTDKEG